MAITQAKLKKMTFEEALAELEAIVNRMEGETLPLAESLSCYETGRLLSEHCATLLKAAQGRIVKLTKENDEWAERPLEDVDDAT